MTMRASRAVSTSQAATVAAVTAPVATTARARPTPPRSGQGQRRARESDTRPSSALGTTTAAAPMEAPSGGTPLAT
jgi:hypothetical protein